MTDREFQLAFHLRRALHELNGIRARDGVPHDRSGSAYSVSEEYFSKLIDEGMAVLESIGAPYKPWDMKRPVSFPEDRAKLIEKAAESE